MCFNSLKTYYLEGPDPETWLFVEKMPNYTGLGDQKLTQYFIKNHVKEGNNLINGLFVLSRSIRLWSWEFLSDITPFYVKKKHFFGFF